ncbi:MAG: thioesterase family protein [Terrimonas ferruginea]|jgi:acyl-CoA thioester hydrolase|uniref:acyl-CoA thioesterase n=1 Tax=Terrimonas ferruginea TaxID=249 RepID=UPI00092A8A54|nr:thioesterase family protein [Terrimonas ferruginea]MBN8782657.1 thioesterase family protein [Terrimonas ferruginea]OJW43868.1 MAG: thioesterase [Sphingobacteriales bacterium 48-107]
MDRFVRELQVRWSDLDPNVHLRHSVYYDWGAFCRIEFLNGCGLTPAVMAGLSIGPILFREEALFKREIRLGDKVTIDLTLVKARADFSRWSIRHEIVKNDDTVAAIVTVDGAWLNTTKRKIAIAPQQVADVFNQIPKHETFVWED